MYWRGRLQRHQVRRGGYHRIGRQEVTGRRVRVSIVEPGVVRAELDSHMTPENRIKTMKPFEGITPLESEDVTDIIVFFITRHWRSAINEVLVRLTEQVF